MAEMTLQDLAKRMQSIDFAMLCTNGADGNISTRPMSNNGDVDYDGVSWFFSLSETRKIAEIERDPSVTLTLTGSKGLLGKPPVFVGVRGRCELIRDRSAFEAHWTKDLDYWFAQGIDTQGLVLMAVRAAKIHYWDGEDEGVLTP